VTSAGTTNFIWDGQDVLLETDVSNNTQVTYTQTPAGYGDLVSQRRSTTTSFYHHDALGSTLALTGSDETVPACVFSGSSAYPPLSPDSSSTNITPGLVFGGKVTHRSASEKAW